MVNNPPAKQEMRVRSLGWDDLLEKDTATHSSILTWRIPWTEEPDRLQSIGSQEQNRKNTHIKINKVTKRSQAKGISSNKGLEIEHVFCLLFCFVLRSSNYFMLTIYHNIY